MVGPRPSSIRLFEGLTIASLLIGILHSVAIGAASLAGTIMVDPVIAGLAFLVSRRRKNWARWILTAMFLLGAGLMALEARSVLAVGYPVVTVAVTMLQAVGLALLFTRESADWIHGRRSLEDVFD